MSSPCLTKLRASVLAAAVLTPLALAACSRTDLSSKAPPPAADAQGYRPVVITGLYPGGVEPPPPDPRGAAYDGNAAYIAEGKRYFGWYNCTGCHFNGGGGIGPALMDKTWIYGGRIDQIYNSIAEGRPNGMPTWRGKIPEPQMWEIAAYVRSLAGTPPDHPPTTAEPPAHPNDPTGTTAAPS